MRAVLTYHSIDPSGSPISVRAGDLERHLRWLAAEGPPVVALERILDAPRDAVALTFDDGFANFEEVAAPLLSDLGLPATLFVVTGRVGRDNAWGDRADPAVPTLPLLDWDRLGRISEAGVELGAHTRTHPRLPTLDETALRDELEGCAADMEARLGRRPPSLAYPYGAVDARVVKAARGVFDLAVTTDFRPVRTDDDPMAVPRLDMFYLRAPGRLEAWGSAGFRRYLAWRRALRRIRKALVRGD